MNEPLRLAMSEPPVDHPSAEVLRALSLGQLAEAAQELGLSVAAVYVAKSRVLARMRQEAEGLID